MSRRDKRGRDAVSRRLTERLSQICSNFSGTDGDFQFASEAERAENVNIGISVRKGNTVLKDAIDKVLSQMTEDDFNQLMDEAIRIQPEV